MQDILHGEHMSAWGATSTVRRQVGDLSKTMPGPNTSSMSYSLYEFTKLMMMVMITLVDVLGAASGEQNKDHG